MRKSQEQTQKEPRSQQRRRFKRAQVDLANWYSVIEEDCIRQGSARIVDLSASGARITTASEFLQGAQITLRFTLPCGQFEVCVRGRIVVSFFDGPLQRYSHGIAFTKISGADQNAIARYVHDVLRGDGPTFDHLVKQWAQSSDALSRDENAIG